VSRSVFGRIKNKSHNLLFNNKLWLKNFLRFSEADGALHRTPYGGTHNLRIDSPKSWVVSISGISGYGCKLRTYETNVESTEN
jgi:hypothetical protein